MWPKIYLATLICSMAACSLDADGDGLTNGEERELGTNKESLDSDGDGIDDHTEVRIMHTDPLEPDSDCDGFDDAEEVELGTDPNDPMSYDRSQTCRWPDLTCHVPTDAD
ncbi:MAG: hypothetical protein ACI9MC_002387, partial [Kiritimatiellia bacterium]